MNSGCVLKRNSIIDIWGGVVYSRAMAYSTFNIMCITGYSSGLLLLISNCVVNGRNDCSFGGTGYSRYSRNVMLDIILECRIVWKMRRNG